MNERLNSDTRNPTEEEIEAAGLSLKYDVFGRSRDPELRMVRPLLVGETFVRIYSVESGVGWFSESKTSYQILSGPRKGELVIGLDQVKELLYEDLQKEVRIADSE